MADVNFKLLLALNILVLPIFLVTLVFNFLSSSSASGIFLNTTGGISNAYDTEITPAPWAFIIWAVIYSWQLLWIIYSYTLYCVGCQRSSRRLNPLLLSPLFFGIYILGLLLNIFWLFMFDRELVELSFAILVGLTAVLFICLAISYDALYKNRFLLAKQGRKCEDVLVRVFVQNGIALYAAWTTIATFLNMAIVITYRSNPPIDVSTASTIALVLLAVVLLIYVALDLSVLDKYARYTITPYAVFVWALSAILVNNFQPRKANFIITAVLLGLAIAALVVKIVLVIVNSFRRPVFPTRARMEEEEAEVEVVRDHEM